MLFGPWLSTLSLLLLLLLLLGDTIALRPMLALLQLLLLLKTRRLWQALCHGVACVGSFLPLVIHGPGMQLVGHLLRTASMKRGLVNLWMLRQGTHHLLVLPEILLKLVVQWLLTSVVLLWLLLLLLCLFMLVLLLVMLLLLWLYTWLLLMLPLRCCCCMYMPIEAVLEAFCGS
jgi:hypothetical protein